MQINKASHHVHFFSKQTLDRTMAGGMGGLGEDKQRREKWGEVRMKRQEEVEEAAGPS